jgi:hypothetical protein
MEATEVLLLLQVPPVVTSDNVVDNPVQTEVVPVMAEGSGFTVIGETTEQPLLNV